MRKHLEVHKMKGTILYRLLNKIKSVMYVMAATLVLALAALIFFKASSGTVIVGAMALITMILIGFIEIGLFSMDNKVENVENKEES